jgi:hypothetical protein
LSAPVPYPSDREQIEESYHTPLRRIGLRVLARLMEWATDLQPKQLNYSLVTDQLAVGGAFRRAQIRHLRARGVTAVVDCRLEASDDSMALAQAGIEFLHLPTLDRHGFTYAQMERGVNWVLERVTNGGRAFLHCEHGVGRGPLMTCAVLVAQGHAAPEALRMVRAARWQALPNDRQLAALLDFERAWRGSHSAVDDAPVLDDRTDGLGSAQPARLGDDVASA